MESLHQQFTEALNAMGLQAMPCPVLHTAPACIRFAVGTGSPYLADHRRPSGAYLDAAQDRALELYRRLPVQPDLLRIHRDRQDAEALPLSALKRLGLPEPEETVSTESRDYFYWRLRGEPVWLRSLLREIIRGELDAAGLDCLAGSVCFLSTGPRLLYQLWDDRWADVAAEDRAALQPLYRSCGHWIPESARELADAQFCP